MLGFRVVGIDQQSWRHSVELWNGRSLTAKQGWVEVLEQRELWCAAEGQLGVSIEECHVQVWYPRVCCRVAAEMY